MLLEGLRCSFGCPVNRHDSVGMRGSATLPHVQQVAEGFQDSPVGKHCRRRREKSIRCGLNLLQSLFGKLLIDKSLLIFLGLTLVQVFAACHQHPVSGWQCPAGLSLPAAGPAKGSQPCSPQPPPESGQWGTPCHTLGTPLGYGKWMTSQVSWSFCPTSLWFQLPESAECWLKGQPGDRDVSLLGSSGV